MIKSRNQTNHTHVEEMENEVTDAILSRYYAQVGLTSMFLAPL